MPKFLALVASAIALTASAHAAVIVTNTSQPTVFTVSNTDLLQQAGTTHVNRDASGVIITDTDTLFTYADGGFASAGVSVLTNGQFGALGTPPITDFAGIRGQVVGANFLNITYTLDTSVNFRGYDLSSVDVYTGWNDGGRSDLIFNLLYSTVAAPTTFLPLISDNYTGATAPSNNRGSVTNNSGPFIASGVKSVRFDFPIQDNSGAGYRELDVLGIAAVVPEPSQAAFLTLGAAMLGLARRRRV